MDILVLLEEILHCTPRDGNKTRRFDNGISTTNFPPLNWWSSPDFWLPSTAVPFPYKNPNPSINGSWFPRRPSLMDPYSLALAKRFPWESHKDFWLVVNGWTWTYNGLFVNNQFRWQSLADLDFLTIGMILHPLYMYLFLQKTKHPKT